MRAGVAFVFLGLAVVVSSRISRAETARAVPPRVEETARPAPLAFTVTPSSQDGAPWTLRVENQGELPMRLAADPRLLVLELVPGVGSSRTVTTVRCTLPADTRPQTDEGRELVIPAKRAWSASFDPRFHCFDAKARALLVPGTGVRARLGFPSPARAAVKGGPAAPFIVAPVGAAVGLLRAEKELVAEAFVIPEGQPTPGATPAPPPLGPPPGLLSGEEAVPPPVHVTATKVLDAARGKDLSLTVTMTNTDRKPLVALLRPSTLRFRVAGPRGNVSCGKTATIDAPIRELFSAVGASRAVSQTVLLTAYCPADTFELPGLYRVTSVVDTTGASGAPLGLKTWDGVAETQTPSLIRVRLPHREGRTPRPTLD